MDIVPDFKNYTLDELFESKESIDQDKYPDRIKEIDLEISKKMSNPTTRTEFNKKIELNKYSTFGPRFWASILDGVVISIISAALVFVGEKVGGSGQMVVDYIDSIQFVAYSVVLHALYGQTVGKMALKVKVVDYVTENSISIKQAILRDCVPIIMLVLLIISSAFVQAKEAHLVPEWLLYSMIFFGASYFIWHFLEIVTMLFNEKNRALHDLIAGTVVVRT